jgi:hypothetical protein
MIDDPDDPKPDVFLLSCRLLNEGKRTLATTVIINSPEETET